MGETIELGENDAALVFRYQEGKQGFLQEIILAMPEGKDDETLVLFPTVLATVLGVMISQHDPEFIELLKAQQNKGEK